MRIQMDLLDYWIDEQTWYAYSYIHVNMNIAIYHHKFQLCINNSFLNLNTKPLRYFYDMT